MVDVFDVIILSGGIHGANLAFHLSQRSVKSIVLERRFLAAGTTGRSGLVRAAVHVRGQQLTQGEGLAGIAGVGRMHGLTFL